ncbi:MAG: ABC transporter ATP-binding protein [Pirellulales bacterium]
MTMIMLDEVSVDYPVFGADGESLKKTLTAAATGGRIGRGTGITVVEALRHITLELRDGDRLGVVGHNGSGKSTLLQTLAGVYPPTRGSYIHSGSIASLVNPMLGIEREATGFENIMIRGLVVGMNRRTIRRLTPEIAEFSGLGDYLHMPVHTYSTGMLMRLAFSITTSVRADILLMDEWLAVGDAEFRQQAEERIRALVSQSGILVIASHSAELIARECNRVIELAHGLVVRDEAIAEFSPAQSSG